MKSREEVEKLKRDWRRDPVWDIYDTEGFEDYRDELAEYQKQVEKEAEERQKKHHDKLASKICPMKFGATTEGGCEAHIGWNCAVEKCAWWNATDECCAVLSIRFLANISDAADVYKYKNGDR